MGVTGVADSVGTLGSLQPREASRCAQGKDASAYMRGCERLLEAVCQGYGRGGGCYGNSEKDDNIFGLEKTRAGVR